MIIGILPFRGSKVLLAQAMHLFDHNLMLEGIPCVQPSLDSLPYFRDAFNIPGALQDYRLENYELLGIQAVILDSSEIF